MAAKISDEMQRDLKTVCDHFHNEDLQIRQRQIRVWKKLKFYWSGFQRLWWSETAHDWRVYDSTAQTPETNSADAAYYDKQFNVFRAYLESIIAALSQTVPPVKCFPDDADNTLDLETARAGDKIAELIFRHIDAPLLWIHALYIYCTEGLLCAYNYTREDAKYGTYEENVTENVEELTDSYVCPNCKRPMGDPTLSNMARDEFDPDDPLEANLLNAGELCPECLILVNPELVQEKIIIPKITGKTTKNKARQCVEIYGGLFVKVPLWAKCQEDMPYLEFSFETHYSNVYELYPELRGKSLDSNSSVDSYGRWGRLSTQYGNTDPKESPTVSHFWLRPSAFNVLDEDKADELKKKFPNGCKVVFVNENFAEACDESLDDHWTLSRNPLSDYVHYDPVGLLLTSVQDITNDLTSLTLQTIEHGIPQTFVDPGVVNLDQYAASEVLVGGLYPAKPKSGQKVSDAFYEVKTATLSGEVLPFAEKTQAMGQLTSGALPSLFGGPQPNSSKTAAQYQMSRASALQRLQTPWKMLTFWWKDIFSKVIPAYMKTIVEDERVVQMRGDRSGFENVFIRRAQLMGKIGSVELEANEQLPIAWGQKKDVIMQLMSAGNPQIMAALIEPENLSLLSQILGLEDLTIPGEDDREKQHEELKLLNESGPVPTMNPMTGLPGMAPSVAIEPLADNHEVHIAVCRKWIVSDAGRLAKLETPEGYQNVLLHMKDHMDIQRVLAMQNAAMQMQAQPAPQKSNEQNKVKPQPMAAPVNKNAAARNEPV